MPVDKLEIEINKFVRNESYSFFSEDSGKKRIYTIYSSELRKRLQAMIFPFGTTTSIWYKGENSFGDRIIYKLGKDDLPDQLTLISRESTKLQEMDEQEKILAESEKLIAELEQSKEKWKKLETELGIPSGDIRHYFSGRKDDKIVYEGMLAKSENQSHLITLENKKNTSPQIQEVNNEEMEQKDKEKDEKTSKNLVEKKVDKEAVFTPHQPNSTQKVIIWTAGLVGGFLILMLINILLLIKRNKRKRT